MLLSLKEKLGDSVEEKLEITITTHIRVSPESSKQVRYLIEKLAEVDAISSEDKIAFKEMTEAFE
jgi:cell division protein FtsX